MLEVRSQFLHSSDLDPGKPINWKRIAAMNGAYGAMGDLGMHAMHLPFRAGWVPLNVRAILSNVFSERPGPDGKPVPCDTWDNAVLLCEADDGGQRFPLRIETKRIAPGETNTWTIEVDGTEGSIAYTTKLPKTLRRMEYDAGRRAGVAGRRPRLGVGVPDDHGRDLRVRLLRRDPADVGGVPRRARPRPRRDAAAVLLRHARGGRGVASPLHRRVALARGARGRNALTRGFVGRDLVLALERARDVVEAADQRFARVGVELERHAQAGRMRDLLRLQVDRQLVHR